MINEVHVAAAQVDNTWFAVAWKGEELVATATDGDHLSSLRRVEACVPAGAETVGGDPSSEFFSRTVTMLAHIEAGDESTKVIRFARSVLSPQMFTILTVAASIPRGYVTSYGDIARAAGSQARAVGRAMATNPLYPVVPCHRVVGADLSLVGYGGLQTNRALRAKLRRLEAERAGAEDEQDVDIDLGGGVGPDDVKRLRVYPVEWAIRAALASEDTTTQLTLF